MTTIITINTDTGGIHQQTAKFGDVKYHTMTYSQAEGTKVIKKTPNRAIIEGKGLVIIIFNDNPKQDKTNAKN